MYVATTQGTQTDPKPTCEALVQLISGASTSALTCFHNLPCDMVVCTAAQLPVPVVIIQILLPCEDPPAIHVMIADSESGSIFLNRTFDESENAVRLNAGGVIFDLTLEQLPDQGAIRYGVSL